MSMQLLPNCDVSYLDAMLLEPNKTYKRLKTLPYLVYDLLPADHLRVWAHRNSIYQFPTEELCAWLEDYIGNSHPLVEIGSGSLMLGQYIGAILTDSYVQTAIPEVAAYYALLGQVPTTPNRDLVEQLDAKQALEEYKPQVVVASWVTQWSDVPGEGNLWGVDEKEIVDNVPLYIHIGNRNTHKAKRILSLPHQEYQFDWLVSRASDQTQNVIYVWDRR